MKFGVISNSLMGVQGIHFLLNQQKIAGIAIPDRFNEANEMAKMVCQQSSVPIHTIRNGSKADDIQNWLKSTQPDAVIAAGCPFKIEAQHLSFVKSGFWNIHAGKLPEYAGPDPVFWQIKNQVKKIILTVHKMTEVMDQGPVLFEMPIELSGDTTYGQLWQKLQQFGAPVIREIVSRLEGQSIQLTDQPASAENYSKRPDQEDLIINWNQMTGDEIIALVNASNPNYGGALGLYRGGYIRILRMKKISKKSEGKPGEIIKADPEGLWVQTKNNQVISIEIANMVDGYLTGSDLVKMDIRIGDMFDNSI